MRCLLSTVEAATGLAKKTKPQYSTTAHTPTESINQEIEGSVRTTFGRRACSVAGESHMMGCVHVIYAEDSEVDGVDDVTCVWFT